MASEVLEWIRRIMDQVNSQGFCSKYIYKQMKIVVKDIGQLKSVSWIWILNFCQRKPITVS